MSSPPPPLPPSACKDGELTVKIPQQMIQTSKEAFTNSAIGKFVGRRPSMEALERWVHSTCRLSRPCFISLTEHGHFLFRFHTKEDSEALVSQSPISMCEGKLLLRLWSPGEEENSWPAASPVWIRVKGVPSHCWSKDIILSIAAKVGEPLRLDETTAAQGILSDERVLVNLDVSKPGPSSLTVELEGEGTVEVAIVYESVPSSVCFSADNLTAKCPFSTKSPQPPLLQTPSSLIQPNSKQNPQANPAPPSELNNEMGRPTKESINEMGEAPPMKPRKPCYDASGGIPHQKMKRPLLQNGDGSINEENRPKSKTMISKWKVIKAVRKVLKVLSREARKFFVALPKQCKKMAKKVKTNFLPIAVASVVAIAGIILLVWNLKAVPFLAMAGLLIAAINFFKDWMKNHGEEGSGSSALHEKNGDLAVGAKAEVTTSMPPTQRSTRRRNLPVT